MVDLTAEQRQLAKMVHDYASRFPLTEKWRCSVIAGLL
jgi:hypothetical protein